MRLRAPRRAGGPSWVVGLLLCALPGCVSNSQGKQMLAQLAEHEQQIQELQEARQEQLERLEEAEARAQQSIDELEAVIERATSVVTRNSADVTVTVSEMQDKIGELEGRLAEMSFALDQARTAQQQVASAQAAATGTSVEPEQIPEDPRAHYEMAYAAFKDKEYERARSLFRVYVQRYPKHDKTDNAQYWIGASYLGERRPASALSELREVIQQHRDGDAVDEALLDMAEAFYRLGACEDARQTLKALIRNQPRSPLVKTAKQKQKELRRPPPGKCKD